MAISTQEAARQRHAQSLRTRQTFIPSLSKPPIQYGSGWGKGISQRAAEKGAISRRKKPITLAKINLPDL